MAHVSLYRKYRPDSFAEVVGQDHVTETLARAVDSQSWHHAYLFCGPRGTGKTSSARLLAMGLNAANGPTSSPDPNDPVVVAIREGSCPDVIEIDAASNSGVDDVRDLRDKIAYSPTQGRLRIYIVDECHMLSNSAWNAFLKTIEEPPGHVVFIFATTEPHKVLPTVLSRTQRFDFRRVSDQVLTDHCKRICAAEGVSITNEALAPIVRAGDGSVRDTLSVLDQVIAFTGNTIDVDAVNRVLGTVPPDLLDQLVNAIARADVADAFGLVGQVAEQGIDLRQFALDAQNHLRELLILNAAPEAGLIEGTPERLAELKASAASTDTDRLLFAVETLNDAQVRMRAGNTRLPLEIALAKAVLYGADRARDIPRLAPKPVTKSVAQPVAATQPSPAAMATVPDAAPEPVRVSESLSEHQPQPQDGGTSKADQAAPGQPIPAVPGTSPTPLAAPAGTGGSHGSFEPEAELGNQADLAGSSVPVIAPVEVRGSHGAFEPEADLGVQTGTAGFPAPITQSPQPGSQHGAFEPEADLGDQAAIAQPARQAPQPAGASGTHGAFEPEADLGDQAPLGEPGGSIIDLTEAAGGHHGVFEPEADLQDQQVMSPEVQPVQPQTEYPSRVPVADSGLEDGLPPEPEQVESLFDDMPGLEPETFIPPVDRESDPAPAPAPITAADPKAEPPAQAAPSEPEPAEAPQQSQAPKLDQEAPAIAPSLADASAVWERVLTLIMGESKRIWSTYSQGEPSQVSGNTVVIGFRFPFHANMAAEPDAIAVASRHFSAVLGTKVKVATETNDQSEPVAPPQPAEEPVEEIEPEVEDTHSAVDEDQQFRDAVALVKTELGATDTE